MILIIYYEYYEVEPRKISTAQRRISHWAVEIMYDMVYFKKESAFRDLAEKVFKREKGKISVALPKADVQHIGSTAIPNSLTKRDLDLQVRVKAEDFDKAIKELSKLYYDNKGNRRTKTYASFRNDDLEIPLGVQLTVIGSKEDDFVKLRNFLINSPKYQREYDAVKRKFNGKNMKDYRKAKRKFFDKIRQSAVFKKLE